MIMAARTTLLTLATLAAAISFGASAQVSNPDNDSARFFSYQPGATPAKQSTATPPSFGQISTDGLYVYSGSDRGWVNRQHSFTLQGGALMHTADCLPYNQPAPVAATVPQLRTGVFADHGA
jgi:hypothetical protein